MDCSRRAFLASLAGTALAAGLRGAPSPAKRPNVLFLYTDDQTFNAIHALGNADLRTPNMDRLAARGTAFLNCYNPGGWHGAICVASRTMMNTGLFLWEAMPLEKRREALGNQPLWGRVWRSGGYHTCMTGKWHVGVDPKTCFDDVRHVRPGMPKTVEAAYLRPVEGKEDPWKPYDTSLGGHWEGGEHWAKVTADDAIAFLREAPKDKPFFAYVAFNAPHDPRQAPKEYVDLYPPEKITLPQNFLPEFPGAAAAGAGKELRDERLAPTPRTPHAVRVHRAEYYALITYLDAQIGRVLDALKATGHEEDTIVALAGDNGLAVGSHGFMGKQNMFEHSMKVPLLLAGPGIPKGQVRDALVYLQDLRPTLLDLAHVPDSPKVKAFRSFAPLLDPTANRGTPFRPTIYGAYVHHQRMLRRGDLKVIWLSEGEGKPGRWLLYDLRKDPLELKDLAADPGHAKQLAELREELREEMRRVRDPLRDAPAFKAP